MIVSRVLVLDTNILLSGILGKRTSTILGTAWHDVAFMTPEFCFHEVRKTLPEIVSRRRENVSSALVQFSRLQEIVENVANDVFYPFQEQSRKRIAFRDPNDWPILAAALALEAPIWTEDRDFFGTGVATWSTANVEIFLRGE